MAVVQGLIPLAVPQAQLPSISHCCYTATWGGRACTTTLVPFQHTVWCDWLGDSPARSVPPGRLSGRKVIAEELWREFFSDPSQWWDHRSEKGNPRYPDFKHKKTQQSLWLDNSSTPSWVEAELAAIAPDTLQSNIFSWNIRFQRYVKAREYVKTLNLFNQIQQAGIIPNKFTFVPVLSACSGLRSLEDGRRVHEQIIRRGYECDVFVDTCLVDMYGKCGSIEDARRVFDRMPSRSVVTWNTMILGFVKCNEGQKALKLYQQMLQERVAPNTFTFVAVLSACATVAAIEKGRQVHEQIIGKGYGSNIFVASSLVDMYAKCGSIEDARRVFDKMPSRNVVSWTAMLAGYAMHGRGREAIEHFERMCQENVEVNDVTFLCLLWACSHGGLAEDGLYYFEYMREVYNISPTMEHYACVADLLGRAGHLHKAEDLIKSMPCEPAATVWMALLGACRIHGDVEMGERVAKQILELEPESASGYVMLSNIYSAAGRTQSAAILHEQRSRSGVDKEPGRTWIEVNSEVHYFLGNDDKDSQIVEVYAELDRLSGLMKEAGYVPDGRFVS